MSYLRRFSAGGASHTDARSCRVRPASDEPGTLAQQFAALGLFWSTPWRHDDRETAWAMARQLSVPHARASS